MTEEVVQETSVYLRNFRPNMVIVPWAGIRYKIQRRGTREDNVALPIEAKKDPTIARWLRIGVLEEISQEDFVELATRLDDDEYNLARAKKVVIPLTDVNSSTPYTIDRDPKTGKSILTDESIKSDLLSPELKWAEEPKTTAEELKVKRGPGRPKKTKE